MARSLQDQLRAATQSAEEWRRLREAQLRHELGDLEARGREVFAEDTRRGGVLQARTPTDVRQLGYEALEAQRPATRPASSPPAEAPPQTGGRTRPIPRPDSVVPMPTFVELPLAGVRSAGNGVALDHADEISAGLDAIIGFGGSGGLRERYRNNLQAELERDRDYSQKYPRVWRGGHVAGAVGGGAAALVGDAPLFITSKLIPRTALAAVETKRVVPFIREGYGVMGAAGGGLFGAGAQLVNDGSKGVLSSPGDLARAGLGGMVTGWQAAHGRPVTGAALGSGLTTGLQEFAHEGAVSTADLLRSVQSGAYGGRALNGVGKYISNALPTALKGKAGEALTFVKSYARGEPIPLRPTAAPAVASRLPNLRGGTAGPQRPIALSKGKTVADWVTSQGRALEAKFGAYAKLSEQQKRALAELGDAFVVDHWLPKNVGELTAGWLGAPVGVAASRPVRER
jgi:hypothetical protein